MNKFYSLALLILAVLVTLSLALNILTIATLLWVRDVALEEVADARALVAGIRSTTLSYTVEVKDEIPVKTTIPFEEEILVPVNTTIPINTTVIVPINAGPLGTFDIDVPILAAVPVNLEVAVPISETIEIDTTVPLALEVPVEIPISETALTEHLDRRDAALDRIEQYLTDPFVSPEVSIGVGE
jgi:hypothetical protein